MIEKIMNKLGYIKNDVESIIDELLERDMFAVFGDDFDKLMVILEARIDKKDVFVDYVKKTNTQKFYVQKGKKKVVVLEI